MIGTWIFGTDLAAYVIARTAWPLENDANLRAWSKRLTDPAKRGLLEAEYASARERLAEAYGALVTAPAPSLTNTEGEVPPRP